MCKWGTSTKLEVTIPARLSSTGEDKRKVVDVDSCISPIVRALNDIGVSTAASCCGHGHRPGNIILSDGRELIIARSFKEGRMIDRLFPYDINGHGRLRRFLHLQFDRLKHRIGRLHE